MPRRRRATSSSPSRSSLVRPGKRRRMSSSCVENLEEALSKLAAIPRRLFRELNDVRSLSSHLYSLVEPNESNMLVWTARLLPQTAPFNSGSFLVQLTFPAEYPFRPPKVQLKTQIYHPNVSEAGDLCLPLVTVGEWKPTMKIDQVLRSVVELIDSPRPEHALRADVAREFNENHALFVEKAGKFTEDHAEARPNIETL